MTNGETIPTGEPPWELTKPRYPFQVAQWDNTETGRSLIVEAKQEPWNDGRVYNVNLLATDHEANPEPIETINEGVDRLTTALEIAQEYMEAG